VNSARVRPAAAGQPLLVGSSGRCHGAIPVVFRPFLDVELGERITILGFSDRLPCKVPSSHVLQAQIVLHLSHQSPLWEGSKIGFKIGHVKPYQTGVFAAAPVSEPLKFRSLEQFGGAGVKKTWLRRLRPRLRDRLPALAPRPLRALNLHASSSGGGGSPSGGGVRMWWRELERCRWVQVVAQGRAPWPADRGPWGA
jgi:hypothetical protein